MKNRIEYLREVTREGLNHSARVPFTDTAEIGKSEGSLYIRKALATAWLYDHAPVCIGEHERIVGTRTLLAANPGNEDGHDPAGYSVGTAMPSYLNDSDERAFGFREEFVTKTHYTPDYGIVLRQGIDGILRSAEERLAETERAIRAWETSYPQAASVPSCFEEPVETDLPTDVLHNVRARKNEREFLSAVRIVWQGISHFVERYAEEAASQAKAADADRREELLTIERICRKVAHQKPDDFYEAIQLFWFAHLSVIMESQEFINFGRVDVLLQPFLKAYPREDAEELLACLLLKCYDQADLKCSYLSRYGGQITMALGGVDEEGNDAVSETTFLLMKALSQVRLTEPLIAFKINRKNPPLFLEEACARSESGLNTIGYYNDDLFIESLKGRGVPEPLANTYAFGLCQDVTVAGYDDNSMGGAIEPIHSLLTYLRDGKPAATFEDFLAGFKAITAREIDAGIERFCRTEKAFLAFRAGDRETYLERLHKGDIDRNLNGRSLMCPLPVLSALFHGCLETATDLTLGGCALKTHGHYLFSPTVTANSLVAIRYAVYDKKICTREELWQALSSDYAGAEGEILRQRLFHAPKWGNNDEYADSICIDYLEFCLKQVQKHKTGGGAWFLSGIHHPHPVPSGRRLMATPDGRHAGDPLSVTMTPMSGTLRNGPLAALASAAKFDYRLINWNFCVMLNYSAAMFREDKGLLARMIRTYFDQNGMQHQPNICRVEDLLDARDHPERYPDLIVRLWGVSVRFIDIDRELQDEVIARFA